MHLETGIPISTLYHYVKRFREGGEEISALSDKSRKPHSHPSWLTEQQKEIVVEYKIQNPLASTIQIAKSLASEGILQISNRTVANILNQRGLKPEFFFTTPYNSLSRLRKNKSPLPPCRRWPATVPLTCLSEMKFKVMCH